MENTSQIPAKHDDEFHLGIVNFTLPPVNEGRDLTTLLQWLKEEEALPHQGTQEWITLRHDVITASAAADVLGMKRPLLETMAKTAMDINRIELKFTRPYSTRCDLLRRKQLKMEPPVNQYMIRGRVEEQLLRHYIEKENFTADPRDLYIPLKCKVHPTHPYLLASPDGAFLRPLRLLELKCIQRRIPKKGQLPHKFFVQAQVQMDVYQIDYLEFLEARIVYFQDEQAFLTSPSRTKSIAYQIESEPTGELYTQPLYMTDSEFMELVGMHKPVYYCIEDIQKFIMKRDTRWLDSIRPILFNFYQAIHLCPQTAIATYAELVSAPPVSEDTPSILSTS
jgi:hypothetical protein